MSITIRGNQENINLFDNAKDVTKTNRKSIDARALTMGNSTDERIEAKRALARKQAMKLVGDAWKRDENGVARRDELSDEKTKTLDKIRDLISKKKDIDNTIENYRQEYGVDIDSQEQKEILEADMKTDKLENSMQLQKTSDSQMDEAQKQVNKILKDNNMINEDIKGIEIDLNF